MIQKFKPYLKKLALFTAIVYALGAIVYAFFLDEYFYLPFVFIPIVFVAIIFTMHIILIKSAEKDLRKFTSRFMMVFGIKILVLLILIVAYVLAIPEQAVPFLITFLIHYLIFTGFETISIVRVLKDSPKRQ
jgi:hypothetical protein